MGPFFLVVLVVWYLGWRFGDDLVGSAAHRVAKAAEKVATVADRLDSKRHATSSDAADPPGSPLEEDRPSDGGGKPAGEKPKSETDPTGGDNTSSRPPRTGAGRVAEHARAVARWLRSRPRPTEPRTAAGQTFLRQAGAIGSAGAGLLLVWLRLWWIDATAAARSARQRRAQARREQRGGTQTAGGRRTGEGWRTTSGNNGRGSRRGWIPPWMSWPTGDDPQAPIKATAERLDREPDTADASSDGTPELEVIDAEVVEDTSPVAALAAPVFPQLSATPVAALPSGSNGSGGHYMETTVAESGLGAYLHFSQDMANSCDEAVNSAEGTLAALTDQDWSGVPVDAITQAMEHLAAARDAFSQAHGAFEQALHVRESYAANSHAGTKESVMSD